MSMTASVRKVPRHMPRQNNYITVPKPGNSLRKAHRRVNGKDADTIPDIVISAIASVYAGGGHPVHWDEGAGAYVMETLFYHVEIVAIGDYAMMRFWRNDIRVDYREIKPLASRRFVFSKRKVV